jgi:cyd operon protein YbgT
MWYFAWLLGLPLAAAFAVLNAMWYELVEDDTTRDTPTKI